ncbi:hypothetical protein OG558_27150 [Kribbella sp. NBC_01510]|uniref:hypothetical protein n=1 Tax=Kribbella sp. NBC_01510 TaxID=2903581 RepID=UPI0038706DEC
MAHSTEHGACGEGPLAGLRVSAWADVGHSLTRSGSCRVVTVERGLWGIALL